MRTRLNAFARPLLPAARHTHCGFCAASQLASLPRLMESDREQAHLPAEQPPPREDARLPASHAHPRRTRDHRGPPPQGPQRTVGLSRPRLTPRPRLPVLPPANRMRRSTDFSSVVRGGVRARSGRVVVHHQVGVGAGAPIVGLVVSKAVGGSVARHRASRRLRAQLAQRLDRLPAGSGTVVRALPAAVAATSAQLGADLDAALTRLAGRG